MVELGWTAHDRFVGSAHEWNSVHVLVRSIARYHAFLDLMSTSITFFVPTIVRVSEPPQTTQFAEWLTDLPSPLRISTSAGIRIS